MCSAGARLCSRAARAEAKQYADSQQQPQIHFPWVQRTAWHLPFRERPRPPARQSITLPVEMKTLLLHSPCLSAPDSLGTDGVTSL